jgi:putative DNA primase/helicase
MPELPCIIALRRDVVSDAPAGIHRIALDDGGNKLGRAMLGQWPKPTAIKLWPVGSSLTITEGIEDALALATTDRRFQPCWSVGCDKGIEKFPILAGVRRLIVMMDKDPHGAGERAAVACAERWAIEAPNVQVMLANSTVGKDANDAVLAKRARQYADVSRSAYGERLGE